MSYHHLALAAKDMNQLELVLIQSGLFYKVKKENDLIKNQ